MNIKKACTVLAAWAVLLSGTAGLLPEMGMFVPTSFLTAKAEIYDGLTYKVLDDGTVEITDCDENLTSVGIPTQIGGRAVTSIGALAFSYCAGLTDVTIPDSVTNIGYEAFYGCTSLKDIVIPDSVTRIGNFAFNDTAWYGAQPYGLVYAGKWLCNYKGDMPDNCTVTLRAGTVGIADSAFSGRTGLTSITIPDSVTSIGQWAFYNCTSLTDIVIPDSVTNIGDNAFCGCTGLTGITIPNGVTNIRKWVFYGCTSLKNVVIPDSVKNIGEWAFYSCTSLKDIVIPNSVTGIGEYAFRECTSLSDITIPGSVTSVERGAFYGCTSLANITILNPDCEICDDASTICNSYEYAYTGTITCFDSSTAQTYAEEYGRSVILLVKYETGDINGDGMVNAVDASILLAASALTGTGQPSGLAPEQETAADVDGQNGFNAVDASYILQYAAYAGNNPGADLDIKSFISGR